MGRLISLAAVLSMIVAAGCKPGHPSAIKIEADFDAGKVGTILVLPAVSVITHGEDPKRESEIIVNRLLWQLLSEHGEYSYLSPEQFHLAVNKAGLGMRIKEFNDVWSRQHVLSADLLNALSSLNVDMILVPQVYLWNKDEADYREEATASATQVGITLSMVDPGTGRVMWEATDENYRESVRTEGERVQSSTGGIDRRIAGQTISGKDVYAAPPFEDVAVLVLGALVGAIPAKVITGT